MNQNSLDFDSSNDLGYGDLFAKLWHRRYWFAGVFTGVLAIAIPLVLAKDPVYQSYMQILAESNYQGKNIREEQLADINIEVDYATQIKVLKSSEILKRVVKKLGLNEDNLETSVEEATQALRGAITVYQVVGEETNSNKSSTTKIIQVNYVGASPTETKRVLEAIEEVYLKYNLEQQEKRLRDALTFIEKQVPYARQELGEAEAALTELTQENNLISPEEEATSIKENIREIDRERKALKAQEREIVASSLQRQEQLQVSPANALDLSRLSQSARYQKILNDLQEIEQDIAAKKVTFTADNPVLQNLLEERKSLKDLLYQEAERTLGELPDSFRNDLDSLQKQGQLVTSDTESANAIGASQVELVGIRQRSQSLAETELELKQRLVEFPGLISQYRNLTQESEIRRQALQKLLEAKQDLEIELSRGGNNWQVIEPAQFGFQIAPNTTKDLLLSIVVASFLGGVAAFARDITDNKIGSIKEIEEKTDYPILGTTPKLSIPASNSTLPSLRFGTRPEREKVSSIKDAIESLPHREAIDLIYENLKISYFDSPLIDSTIKSLSVTSAISGEGKSTFILGLASSIARQRKKVLVIDADLRCPSLHEPFGLNNHSGMTNFFEGEVERPLIQQVSLLGERIDLITSGTNTNDSVKLLNSYRFKDFLERQKETYDFILVDSPPVLGMVDALKIASICDTALIVTRLNKTKVSDFLETSALLSKLNVLGIIVSDNQNAPKMYGANSKYLLPEKV